MNWKQIVGMGVFLYVLYFFSGILQAIFLIPVISGWLTPLGINKHFAFALAIPLFFWFNCAMGKLFSIYKINRTVGLVMILSVFFVISLIQGIQTNGDRFDREIGTSNFSYSRDGSHIKLLPANVRYDPETGLSTQPLTPEVAKEYEASKKETWKNGGLREMQDMYQNLSK